MRRTSRARRWLSVRVTAVTSLCVFRSPRHIPSVHTFSFKKAPLFSILVVSKGAGGRGGKEWEFGSADANYDYGVDVRFCQATIL